MDNNIVSAAKWIGVSLMVSSFVISIGFYCAITDSSKVLASSLPYTAANASRGHQTLELKTPDRLEIEPLRVNLAVGNPSYPLQIGTIKVENVSSKK